MVVPGPMSVSPVEASSPSSRQSASSAASPGREAELLELLDGRDARIIVSVVGGQGYVLGRGNQQLSPEVVRRVGLDNLVVVASLDKLLALDPPRLLVDTGDPELDEKLCGYRRVRVAPGHSVVFPVAA